MQNDLQCPMCLCVYDNDRLPRLFVCGHTFCEQCIMKLITPKANDQFEVVCPSDSFAFQIASESVNYFSKNIALIHMLQNEQNSVEQSFDDSEDHSSENSSQIDNQKLSLQQCLASQTHDLITQQQTQQKQQQQNFCNHKKDVAHSSVGQYSKKQIQFNCLQSQMLVSYKKSASTGKKRNLSEQQCEENQQRFLESQQDSKVQACSPQNSLAQCGPGEEKAKQHDENINTDICLLHQKPLEVVCMQDLEKICAKCAIFGNHRGHEFKSLEQVEDEYTNFEVNILKVYEAKEAVVGHIANKGVVETIMETLTQRKNSLSLEISERYEKLAKLIKEAEAESQEELNQIMQNIELNLKIFEEMKRNQALGKLEKWEQNTYKYIKVLSESSFEDKLQMVFRNSTKENIIKNGQEIMEEMLDHENNLMTRTERMVDSINLHFQDATASLIKNYCFIENGKTQAVFSPNVPPPNELDPNQEQQGYLLDHIIKVPPSAAEEDAYVHEEMGLELKNESLVNVKNRSHHEEADILRSNNVTPQKQVKNELTLEQKQALEEEQQFSTQALKEESTVKEQEPQLKDHSTIKVQSNIKEGIYHSEVTKQKMIASNLKLRKIQIPKKLEKEPLRQDKNGLKLLDKAKSPRGEIGDAKRRQMRSPTEMIKSPLSDKQGMSPTLYRRSPNIRSKKQLKVWQVKDQQQQLNRSFDKDKNDIALKKKIKAIKVSEKYQKVLEGLYENYLDIVDFTNAQLGNNTIIQICQLVQHSKARTLKLIRNKLTDEVIVKILPSLKGIVTLNLSQNMFSERILEVFEEGMNLLPELKNLVLSQNRIIQRKHRIKIEKLRKLGLIVSV